MGRGGDVETMILLETERMRLRRFTARRRRPAGRARFGPRGHALHHLRRADAARSLRRDVYLPRWLALYEAQPRLGYFAAEDRDSGEFLGWFHLRDDRIEPAVRRTRLPPAALGLGARLRDRRRAARWSRTVSRESGATQHFGAHAGRQRGLAARHGKMRPAPRRRIRLRRTT